MRKLWVLTKYGVYKILLEHPMKNENGIIKIIQNIQIHRTIIVKHKEFNF